MLLGMKGNFYKPNKKIYMFGFIMITFIVAAYNPKNDEDFYNYYIQDRQ